MNWFLMLSNLSKSKPPRSTLTVCSQPTKTVMSSLEISRSLIPPVTTIWFYYCTTPNRNNRLFSLLTFLFYDLCWLQQWGLSLILNTTLVMGKQPDIYKQPHVTAVRLYLCGINSTCITLNLLFSTVISAISNTPSRSFLSIHPLGVKYLCQHPGVSQGSQVSLHVQFSFSVTYGKC